MGNYVGIDTPDTVCGINLDQLVCVEYNRNTNKIKFITTNAAVPELNIPGSVDFFNSIAKKIGIGGVKNG